ncbi:CHAT domain-containing protein, partial [Cellulomonas endophytica]|uniref:CHAT domain-containing protein n=1 Tax=Cellulomonas endophytica TaxID=2494735 RepID=UPI0013E95DB6
ADLARASAARRGGPAEVRARAWLGEALLREASGDRRGAATALRAGARVLEEHRATLGAAELRAHVTSHRGAIARAGLRLALEDGDARAALAWAERGRAGATRPRRAQPPADPVLADLLAELRATVTEVEERRHAASPTDALVRRQVLLERRVRDRCREDPGAPGATEHHPPLTVVRAALGDAALVEFAELDGVLHAVVVRRGRLRLHHLGPTAAVRAQTDLLPFALGRLALGAGRPASRAAALALLERAGAVLDGLLLRPLASDLGDAPLVVVPGGALASVPWSLLPSCAGRPVSVNPSAAAWTGAWGRTPPADGRHVVVAGPGLAGADAEARAVARLHPGAQVLVGAAATTDAVAASWDGAALVHLAAHGRVRADNPLFSSLALADGPFTVYDLERLRRAPHHVVLAACDTGRPQVVAGDEVLGVTAALLTGGTATLVASVAPVADAATVALMEAYHAGLRRGRPPAAALAEAQLAARDGEPAVRAAAAGFVLLGDGDHPLPGVSPRAPAAPTATMAAEPSVLATRGHEGG